MKQYNYRAGTLTSSDHKPVSAVFGAKVKVINKEKQEEVIHELSKLMNNTGLDEKAINSMTQDLLVDFSGSDSGNFGTFSLYFSYIF
jgi:hypothetical protein